MYKRQAVEADIIALNVRAEALRKRLEVLVQADAEAFLPVAAVSYTHLDVYKRQHPARHPRR